MSKEPRHWQYNQDADLLCKGTFWCCRPVRVSQGEWLSADSEPPGRERVPPSPGMYMFPANSSLCHPMQPPIATGWQYGLTY